MQEMKVVRQDGSLHCPCVGSRDLLCIFKLGVYFSGSTPIKPSTGSTKPNVSIEKSELYQVNSAQTNNPASNAATTPMLTELGLQTVTKVLCVP